MPRRRRANRHIDIAITSESALRGWFSVGRGAFAETCIPNTISETFYENRSDISTVDAIAAAMTVRVRVRFLPSSARHFSYRSRITKPSGTKENIDVGFGVSEQWSSNPKTVV
jgi:hypothetical protein